MPKSRIKAISHHKNNIATKAKREYNFWSCVSKLSVPNVTGKASIFPNAIVKFIASQFNATPDINVYEVKK